MSFCATVWCNLRLARLHRKIPKWSQTIGDLPGKRFATQLASRRVYRGYSKDKKLELLDFADPAQPTTFSSFWYTGVVLLFYVGEVAQADSEEHEEDFTNIVGEKVTAEELKSRFELIKASDGSLVEVGVGAYGQVFKAHDKFSGRDVAVKVVEKTSMTPLQIRNEVDALRISRMHPNVVELIEVLDCPEINSWYIITELCEGGELFDRLIEDGPYGEGLASRLVARVADALHHIHSHGFVHMDIKPENMVFERKGEESDGLDLRIVDFGMAQRYMPQMDSSFNLNANVGTTAYWPPELLKPFYTDKGDGRGMVFNNKTSITIHSDPRACDMWALGVILFILLLGCHPFDPEGRATETELAKSIIKNERASMDMHGDLKVLTSEVKDLINQLLEISPERRLTAYQVLEHPWIQRYKDVDVNTLKDNALIQANNRLKEFVEVSKVSRIFSTALLYTSLLSMAEKYRSSEVASSTLQQEGFLNKAFSVLDSKKTGKVNQESVKTLLNALRILDVENFEGCIKSKGIGFEEFATIVEKKFTKQFKKGEIVFKPGDDATGMYIVLSGLAQLEYTGSRNKFRPAGKLYPGDLFGETALLDGRSKRNATVRCLEDMQVVYWDQHAFLRALSGSDVLTSKLEEIVYHRQNMRAKAIIEEMIEPRTKILNKGTIIFHEGDQSDSLYLIQRGIVEASVSHVQHRSKRMFNWGAIWNSRRNALIRRHGPGDIVGSCALIGGKRQVTAKCVTEVELIEVTKTELKDLIKEPSLKQNLLRLSRRVSEAAWERRQKD